MNYDVIVVGGGHAGCEAVFACAKNNLKTLLITGNINNIADMPCNPSIGGSAKGIVVREIDALGGIMGEIADATHIQIKFLNRKKGPGVRSLRCQSNKKLYSKKMIETLKTYSNIKLLEGLVKELIVENNEVIGVKTENGKEFYSKKTILTTGTYLNSDIMRGHEKHKGGPHGEKPSLYLSESLKKLGLKIIRLKTGTPPRIDGNSVDYSKIKIEKGDNNLLTFSNFYKASYKVKEQVPCYLTYTNEKTHEIILNNLDKCALYSGMIEGVGPRYCPSIEDKIVKFRDKDRHQIFLESNELETNEMYVGGFSTTMPEDIQKRLLHTIKGLENSIITKYGYAIEYDAIDPRDLNMSLETKKIKNLYTAGQINGTSGYEEAAAQGLIAGINASFSIKGKDPLILKRNEAYIGVLIDDLINKGITEPYRLLTSRAEFRLLLRHDNADVRLTEIGRSSGLIDDKKYRIFTKKIDKLGELQNILKNTVFKKSEENNEFLIKNKSSKISSSIKLIELIKRPEIKLSKVLKHLNIKFNKEIIEEVEINIKYKGYIDKTKKEVEKMLNLEKKKIPADIDYSKIKNIATEARQKLELVRPLTISQASRISGINPSDISMLLIYLKKEYPNE